MITKEFAEKFARAWIDSWNSHSLEDVLSHYHDDFRMSSPKIIKIMNLDNGLLDGKSKIREYWSKALNLFPNLKFELIDYFVGVDSVAILYKSVSGPALEVFFFDSSGLVIRAAANYK
ncbi:nuclear transport factor 2 family protein [Cellvibrio sp. KY-GH-1]|uniref:nuclear transport factor 2 family protein n=1 Tax=Cellvibrio sp. KY-GH-1 TaxID=2303332 RepID=UPI001245D17F|nr:nuclear transport factor 2 family protein [Cellvibrio sp. KY-GH-1]QEY16773.1 nuclear transport factor 2 family protein [Cellvibrio sp. KY-GH-1]